MKQRNISWLGAFIASLYTALPALSIINFFLIVVAVYEPIQEFLKPVFPWFNFTWFIVAIGVFTAVATMITYLVVVPSLNTFNWKQMNKFDSPVMQELRKIKIHLGITDNGEVEDGVEVITARRNHGR